MLAPVSFNGVELNDGFFSSDLLNAFNADKDLVLNDLLGDGQAWGSSKVADRKLVLNIVAGAYNLAKLMQLNKMVRGNQLKPMVIDTDIGQLIGYAEVTSFAWSDDSPLIISAQLTMPDPCWYAAEPTSVALGATYNTAKTYPYTYPRAYGAATGGEGALVNDGNADAYPVITVAGTCSNITVANETTGENISVSPALAEDDELVIDCRPDTCGIYLNGIADIRLKTIPGWIHCPPGNNTFVFSRNSLQNKKHCIVQLRSRWI